MHKRIFGKLLPLRPDMDLAQLRSKAAKIPLQAFSIEELRGAKKILSLQSHDLDNSNVSLQFFDEMLNLLSVAERQRPTMEQFPFVRLHMCNTPG